MSIIRNAKLGITAVDLDVGDCLVCGENNWSADEDSICLTCANAEDPVEVNKCGNDYVWYLLIEGTDEEIDDWLKLRDMFS